MILRKGALKSIMRSNAENTLNYAEGCDKVAQASKMRELNVAGGV